MSCNSHKHVNNGGMLVDNLLTRARDYAEAKGWRATRLAKEMGLHPNTLIRLHDPTWSPQRTTLAKMEKFLNDEAA